MKSKCPFCLSEYLELEEVDTDDGVRAHVVCSNCGLQGPGSEYPEWKEYRPDAIAYAAAVAEADELAWKFWDEMAQVMGPIWNKDEYPIAYSPKIAKALCVEPPTITIRTGGGVVWDVENLPDGWEYEVIDEEDEDETD